MHLFGIQTCDIYELNAFISFRKKKYYLLCKWRKFYARITSFTFFLFSFFIPAKVKVKIISVFTCYLTNTQARWWKRPTRTKALKAAPMNVKNIQKKKKLLCLEAKKHFPLFHFFEPSIVDNNFLSAVLKIIFILLIFMFGLLNKALRPKF